MFRRGYEVREMKLNKLLTQKLAVETAFWEREKKILLALQWKSIK